MMAKRQRRYSCLSAAIIASISLSAIGVSADEATVEVDLSIQRYLGGESELIRDKFFNMHDNHMNGDYSAEEVEYFQDTLNASAGRAFYSPLQAHAEAPYPAASDSMVKGAETVEARKNNRLAAYGTKRMVMTDHPKNVYQPHRDPAAMAEWAADYFEYYYDDETRPMFYEPMNEPFVHAGDYVEGWDPVANKIHQDGMTAVFSEIGRVFDERGLDVNVIGYSAAWPSMELWEFGHWDSYMKSFMDLAGDNIDSFSTHLYDGINVTGQNNLRSGGNTDAILDLIETYSNVKWDVTKPHAITEYGGIVDRPAGEVDFDEAINSQELRSYNHILFGLLERQDRILTSIPFITGKSAWFYKNNNFQPYSAAIMRPDPDKIFGTKVNGFLPTQKAKFFELWRDVRGKRAAVKTTDPDLYAQAFVHGPYAYVALNNLDAEDKLVNLDFFHKRGTVINTRIKRLNVPTGEVAIYSDVDSAIAPESVTLAPSETVIIEYTFDKNIKQRRAIKKTAYYADEHLQEIVADEAIAFNFADVKLRKGPIGRYYKRLKTPFEFDHNYFETADPWASFSNRGWGKGKRFDFRKYFQHSFADRYGYNSSRGFATLRMSLGRAPELSKQPEVYVNGHKMIVPNDRVGYDQEERSVFFGTVEVQVPIKYLKPDTKVDVVFADGGGHVSTVVLDVEKRVRQSKVAVEGLTLSADAIEMNKDRIKRIRASVAPANASDKYVVWTSSDETVATVAADGTVTPVSPGLVTITAQTHDGGFVAETQVTVLDQLSIPDTVTIIEDFSDEVVSNQYRVQIAYSAPLARDINLELRSPSNAWLGGTTVNVPAGEGELVMTLNFAEALPAGEGYRFAAGIRLEGGTWRDTLDGHAVPGVIIVDPNAPLPGEDGILAGVNADFETGDMTDWSALWNNMAELSVAAEAGFESDYGWVVDASLSTVNTNGGGLAVESFPQGVFEDGKTYRISFDYRNPSNSSAWAGGYMSLTSNTVNNGGWASMIGQKWFGGANTVWKNVAFEFTTDYSAGVDWSLATDLSLTFTMQGGQVYHFDNLVIEEVTP